MNDHELNREDRLKYIRKTAGNVSSTLIIRLLRYPFLALYFIIIPRMMGSHEYGKFALLVSALMLLSEFLSFGSPVSFGKLFPEMLHNKENEKAWKLFWGYVYVWVVVSILLLLTAVLVSYSGLEREFDTWIIFIFVFSLITEILSQLFFSVLFGLNEVGKYNLVHLFRTSLRLLFLYLLYPVLGFTGAVMTLLLTSVFSLLYGFIAVRKNFPLKYSAPDIVHFRPVFSFGLAIFAPTLLFIIQQQSGPLFLKLFNVSNQEIGFFDLANQSFLVLYGLTVTIYETLIPISSRFEVIGLREKAVHWLTLLLRYIMSIFMLTIFSFYYFGEQVIDFIIGNDYKELYHIAVIIIISIPFWSIGQIGYVRSVITANSKVYVYSAFVSTLTYIVSGFVLTYFFRGQGLAAATVLSAAAYSFTMLLHYSDIQRTVLLNVKKILYAALIFIPGFFISREMTSEIFFYVFSVPIFIWLLIKSRIIDIEELHLMLSFRKTM